MTAIAICLLLVICTPFITAIVFEVTDKADKPLYFTKFKAKSLTFITELIEKNIFFPESETNVTIIRIR